MNVQDLVDAVGLKRGHFASKANRIAKLIAIWPTLEAKLVSMIERGGGTTQTARLAYAVLLMMETGIRTGNETSAEGWICENQILCRKDNAKKGLKVGDVIWQHPAYGQHVQTYGLTTLLNGHVIRKGKKKIQIAFVGKKLVDQVLTTSHPTLVKHLDNVRQADTFLGITYNDLKKFVKKSVGRGYTPKDLRMTKANLIFVSIMGNSPRNQEYDDATTKSARRKVLKEVIEETAGIIGHTKSVCKSAYLSQPLVHMLYHKENA